MKNIIQQRLAEKIKQSGLSLVQIAKQVGVSQSMLSQYLHYGKMPSLTTFASICKVISASADYILNLQ